MPRKPTKITKITKTVAPGLPAKPSGKTTHVERRQAHMIQDPLRIVFTTAPESEAEALATKLLEERLVACVNLIKGVSSLYWWEGKIERSSETVLMMKTPASRINALRQRLKSLHSYTVPEFLTLQVMEFNPAYAAWAAAETKAVLKAGKA